MNAKIGFIAVICALVLAGAGCGLRQTAPGDKAPAAVVPDTPDAAVDAIVNDIEAEADMAEAESLDVQEITSDAEAVDAIGNESLDYE